MTSNQRFVLILVAILMTGLCIVNVTVARPGAPKVVRAQSFEVVDAAGKPRITLSVQPNGDAEILLGSRDKGGILLLHDVKASTAYVMTITSDAKTGKISAAGLATAASQKGGLSDAAVRNFIGKKLGSAAFLLAQPDGLAGMGLIGKECGIAIQQGTKTREIGADPADDTSNDTTKKE